MWGSGPFCSTPRLSGRTNTETGGERSTGNSERESTPRNLFCPVLHFMLHRGDRCLKNIERSASERPLRNMWTALQAMFPTVNASTVEQQAAG
jgi:hypothetical protein